MKLQELGIVCRNFVLGGNLQTIAALGRPRMAAHYVAECRFLYRCMFPNQKLMVKPVWEALGVEEISVVLSGQATREWFRPTASFAVDLISVCMLCQILKPKVVFEIGTYRGAGALHWAANSREAQIYTLDLPPSASPALTVTTMDRFHISSRGKEGGLAFEGRQEAQRIHCLYGDSASFDFSPYRGAVDLFFVDGAHSYEYVRNDSLRAFECCRSGGVVAWHDYGRAGVNGVSKYLHELVREEKKIYRVPGGSLAYMQV